MLPLLIDENLNQRILRGLKRTLPHLDYVITQNAGLRGVQDPPLLDWAPREARILLTHDLKTVPKYAYERVKSGQAMPGVIAVPDSMPIGQAIEDLLVLIECAKPAELDNRVLYLPL